MGYLRKLAFFLAFWLMLYKLAFRPDIAWLAVVLPILASILTELYLLFSDIISRVIFVSVRHIYFLFKYNKQERKSHYMIIKVRNRIKNKVKREFGLSI